MHAIRTPLLLLIATAGALLLSGLAIAPAEATQNAHYYYSSGSSGPCPNWSVQGVLDDPDGDWDGDRVSNADEIYVAGGLNPCVYDSTQFCGLQPASCYHYRSTDVIYYYVPVVTTCSGGYWNWSGVTANPHGDWDGDGVTNFTEANNGANPCKAPCPRAYQIDVALNPWGDWDGDGRSNSAEVNAGTNPCSFNHYVYARPAPQQQTSTRLPHVGGPSATPSRTTYTAPAPTVSPCPAGYPYFHPGNGQCYANPVPAPTGW